MTYILLQRRFQRFKFVQLLPRELGTKIYRKILKEIGRVTISLGFHLQ